MVQHGRWTRGLEITLAGEPMTIRMVEAESVLGWNDPASENDPQELEKKLTSTTKPDRRLCPLTDLEQN